MPKTLCIAHRGASAEKPENTLAAFRRAAVLKCDGVELDVQVSADGVPFVFHDDDLKRLTGATGKIGRLNSTDILKLRVRGEKIPTLSQILRAIGRKLIVQIEMKKGVAVVPIIRSVLDSGCRDKTILASFEIELLKQSLELAPGIPRMLIASKPMLRTDKGIAKFLLRKASVVEATGVSLDHSAIKSAVFVRTFKTAGVSLWTWTVNDCRRMRQLAGWGVNAILSDDPRKLKKTLRII